MDAWITLMSQIEYILSDLSLNWEIEICITSVFFANVWNGINIV